MLRTRLGKFFLIIFLTITLIMILYSYSEYQDAVKLKYLEKEKELLGIATQLNDRITSYDKILMEKRAERLGDDEKTQILNEVFQPIVLQIASKYPKTVIGLYSKELDRNVAIGPQFDQSFLRKVTAPNAFIVYQTGVYQALKIEKSIAWNGKSVFAVHLPIVREGKMIGHAFANTTIEFLDQAIYIETIQRIKFIFIIWLLVVLQIYYVYYNLRKARAELIRSITNNLDTSLLEGYSEYVPIIQAFNNLHQENLKHKDYLETILNSISDFYFALDKNLVFTYCNKAAIRDFYGYNPVGKHIWTEFPQTEPRIMEAYEKAIYENQSTYYEAESKVSIGRWMCVNVYPAKDGGVSVFFRDVTERRALQQQLQRLDQLSWMSQIACSISHEVRNPLTTVRGYLQLLSTKPDVTHYNSKFELLISELDRATTIIEEFLSAARLTQNKQQAANINAIITQLQPLLEADASKVDHEVEFTLSTVPDLMLSIKEIKQLINNLTRNAFESMEKYGRVVIGTECREGEVVLTISDNGRGIPQEVLDKLGTPFLTTKDNGTGLGLAVCYGIAENHNARIDVSSSAEGTTFYIRFPIIEEIS